VGFFDLALAGTPKARLLARTRVKMLEKSMRFMDDLRLMIAK
jgi:hypothetical protein